MNTINKRHYDIDFLRVITIGLLLLYHIIIVFQPWGGLIRFIQSSETLEELWIPMMMINIWRIPLLFFVSGMGVYFAMRKRDWKALFLERSKRILLPFIFGALAIVPIHMFLWQRFYNQDISYAPNPGHLWFLLNLVIYVAVLYPAFYYMQQYRHGKTMRRFKRMLSHPLGIFFVATLFIVEAIVINPQPFEMYAMTFHGFILGLLAFFFGYCFAYTGVSFWKMVVRWKWMFLLMAFSLFLMRIFVFTIEVPIYLYPVESVLWIYGILGISHAYLNRNSKTLVYLSNAAYPVYIIHMAILYIAAIIIIPLPIMTYSKLLIITSITIGGCFLVYELIRRIPFIRILFGMK